MPKGCFRQQVKVLQRHIETTINIYKEKRKVTSPAGHTSMNKSDAILRKIKTLGKSILPKDSSLWLYGSRARGTAHAQSDWDLLILLNKDKTEFDDYGKYAFPIAMLGATLDQEITPQIYTKKQWEAMSFTPFYKNVEQDKKVILWD